MGQIKEMLIAAADKRAIETSCSWDEALEWAQNIPLDELERYTKDCFLTIDQVIARYKDLELVRDLSMLEKSALHHLQYAKHMIETKVEINEVK